MIKQLKLLLITFILCSFSMTAFSVEEIVSFEENSVPILNEELRKIGVDTKNSDANIATNTTDIETNTTTIASLNDKIVQVVNTQTGALATGTTVMPFDDTIPQISEGDEFMTRAITPTSSTNFLRIEVVWIGAMGSYGRSSCVALFQDTTPGALAVGTNPSYGTNQFTMISFSHYMIAGTTSATTFRVRAGGLSGTTYFNGHSSGTILFGGVLASSITITEIAS